MCIIPSQNWRWYLNWWLKEQKQLKLEKYIFTTHLAHGSNVFLALKFMNFDDVDLTKNIHFVVIEAMNG